VTEINNLLELRGRRILVTGAASGIGLATCQLLSRLGGRVIAIDSNAEGVTMAVGSFEGKGHESRCFDLRRIEDIPSMLVEVATEGDPLFGVVHAAGLSCIQPARLLAPRYYRDVMLVNTEAALALARGFISKKVSDQSGGSIVFVSSVMAWAGSPGAVAYGMSKAALTGMAKSLAVELAPRKIRVNCVAPGFVKSPMFDRVSGMWDADQRGRVESEHLLGFGEPADVANAIAFLLADSGRWITGSVLVVDGGYTAH
jgi:NAD(P)-dependent dehydrogenase (short-subunit alcohol dehydrogenase family)